MDYGRGEAARGDSQECQFLRIGDADCWDTRRELVGEPIASTRHRAESGLPSSRGVFRNQCSCEGVQRKGEKVMSTPGIPVESDFRTRAKTNDVPVARLIGFEAKEIAEGRATVTLSAGPQHANPMGTLNGGILCAIADAAMRMAFARLSRLKNPSAPSNSKSTSFA